MFDDDFVDMELEIVEEPEELINSEDPEVPSFGDILAAQEALELDLDILARELDKEEEPEEEEEEEEEREEGFIINDDGEVDFD